MSTDERLFLIKQVGEEIVTEDELKNLLRKKERAVAYDGFEPSGKVHIAQGLLRAININKLVRAGIRFKMVIADWHAWANNKLGGKLEDIQTAGKYMIEVWKACGLDTNGVEFVWASELVKKESYWMKVMNVARASTVKRIIRCSQIMGRSESETLSAAQILYPCMQAADIFELNADITQLGMDQRKVNVLAREIGPKLGFWKPVIISHHMLMGLQALPTGRAAGSKAAEEMSAAERATAMKMSKSNPDSAIFMTDSEKEVERKIRKAHCPERQVAENPVLEYCRYLVFEMRDRLEISRPEKYGGNVSFSSYDELEAAFSKGELHPADLKQAVARSINAMLGPVRRHFEKNREAKALNKKVSSFTVTR